MSLTYFRRYSTPGQKKKAKSRTKTKPAAITDSVKKRKRVATENGTTVSQPLNEQQKTVAKEPPQKKHKSGGERPVLVFEDYSSEIRSTVAKKCNFYQNSGFPDIAETDLVQTKVEGVRRLRTEFLNRQQKEAAPSTKEIEEINNKLAGILGGFKDASTTRKKYVEEQQKAFQYEPYPPLKPSNDVQEFLENLLFQKHVNDYFSKVSKTMLTAENFNRNPKLGGSS